jgi:hypothetical protein
MSELILVQRAAQIAEGKWRMRFGYKGLVVTIEVTKCYEMNRALDLAGQIAEKQFESMLLWNEAKRVERAVTEHNRR